MPSPEDAELIKTSIKQSVCTIQKHASNILQSLVSDFQHDFQHEKR